MLVACQIPVQASATKVVPRLSEALALLDFAQRATRHPPFLNRSHTPVAHLERPGKEALEDSLEHESRLGVGARELIFSRLTAHEGDERVDRKDDDRVCHRHDLVDQGDIRVWLTKDERDCIVG
jgi:hypothetical protein